MSYTYGFYSPNYYSADDKESLLKRAAATTIAEGSYAERLDLQEGRPLD